MLHFADLFKAVLLGIIEGLTEFIPVSSTAHLLISSYLIDFQTVKNGLFEITIQFGAILAICVAYRQKIISVICNLNQKHNQKFSINLALAFLPAAFFGGLFHSYIKEYLFSNLVIALSLIIGGIIMIIIDRKPHNNAAITEIDDLKPKTALSIGLFQCLAMIPGVSRSGATIIGGLILGLNRKSATEFSFFLAIPTITAATFYDLFVNSSELTGSNVQLIIVGLLAAFFSALLVIKWFIAFVSKHNFVPFGIYRIIVGILILLFIANS